MAELSTIARPYAEALFGVALADKAGLTGWAELMSELAQLASLTDVRTAVSDPHLNKAQCLELFASLIKTPLSPEAKNFLSLLIENNRLLLLPEIASQFHDLKNSHEGAADADIVSAFALDDQQLSELVQSLEKKFGLKIIPTVRVDASLIGGVRVIVGDQVLDTSVSTRLAQMRDALTV